MQDDESLRREIEVALGQLEELAEQGNSKLARRLLVRSFRRLVEKVARHAEERAGRDEPS